jgi:hypothetical protein
MIILALVLLVVFGAIARRLYDHDPPPPGEPANPTLTGIGGWLVLPLLGLLLLPFAILFLLAVSAENYFGAQWGELTRMGGASYHPLWAPALLLELTGMLAQLVFGLLLLTLLLKKRSSLPRLYIGYMITITLVSLGLFLILGQLPIEQVEVRKEATQDLMSSVGELILWGIYFSVSVRVKSTFRVRRQANQTGPEVQSVPAAPAIAATSDPG